MTLQLTILNMAYSGCGEAITKAVKPVELTAMVEVDPKTLRI